MGKQLLRSSSFWLVASCFTFCAPAAFATDVDLRTLGATGSIGAGSFEQIVPQSTGTGVIDPFLRIQANGEEQGFNTSHSPLNGDLKDDKPGPWTHALQVSDLVPVLYHGVLSARFLLDINQTGSNPQLSLDALKILTAPVGDLSTNASLFSKNLIYDMGAGNRVLLDFSLGSGSGSGDMNFYLPWSLFSGLANQNLYLYSKFGSSGGDFASNDGFEEWAHKTYVLPTKQTTWGSIKVLYPH